MAMIKHPHVKGRYIVVDKWGSYADTPSYGYTAKDANTVDILRNRIISDKKKIEELHLKAHKQDKRYD